MDDAIETALICALVAFCLSLIVGCSSQATHTPTIQVDPQLQLVRDLCAGANAREALGSQGIRTEGMVVYCD